MNGLCTDIGMLLRPRLLRPQLLLLLLGLLLIDLSRWVEIAR